MSSEQEMARLFKALGDENRLLILKLLQTGERCGCELLEQLQITQPTLSHHLKTLCDCGIVQGRRDGKWMHYSIDPRGLRAVSALLQSLLNGDCSRKEGKTP